MIDSDLLPFEPPDRPMGLLGIPTFLRSYIETFPRSAYEQPTTRITTRFSDTLLVCDPKLIQEVLVERADAFGRDEVTRRAIAPLVGESSLFLAEGADWRWQRRVVAPTFRHETLLSFVPVFAEMARRLIERWRNTPSDIPIEVGGAMTQTTFDIIVETMLGGLAAFDVKEYGRSLMEAAAPTLWNGLLAMSGLPRWVPFPGRRVAVRGCAIAGG